MFNLTQSVSEPTHNQGHLLDLVFSNQSDNILVSTKLHNGLTSDYTANLMYLYPYKNLKPFRTDASERLTPAPLNKISLTLSHKSVLSVTTITISVLSLTSTLKSKLTVHKQIYDSIKQKVTNLIDKAKQA